MSRSRRIASLLFDLMVAGTVLAGAVASGVAAPRSIIAIGAVMGVALLWRRRWPTAVLAVVAVAALVQVIAFGPEFDPQPFDVAVVIAMFSVVKYARRLLDAYLAAAVVAIGIAIEIWRHESMGIAGPLLVYGGVSLAIWLSAYVLRNRRQQLAVLQERAATLEREREHLAREREHLARIAVADERATIARELHDVIAHSLSVMIVQADGGRYAYDTDPTKARDALATVAATGREALADMRALVGVLRGTTTPESSTVEGSMDRRRVGLAQLGPLVERARSAGLSVTLDVVDQELPPAVELTVTRLVQESLTNALRHAGSGARVRIAVSQDTQTVRVSCVDDGGSVDRPRAKGSPPGHGLIGMRERVAVHEGTLHAGPAAGGGWCVEAVVPLVAKTSASPARTVGAARPDEPAVAA